MDTRLTYRPRDFLLFSPETYWRLFERANAELWPLPVLAPIALVTLVGFALTGRRPPAFLLALALGASFIVVSEAFLAAHYEPINWAVAYLRPAFVVEAALLATLGLRLSFPAAGLRLGIGVGLVALAAIYPLVGLVSGRPLAQAEAFAVAPDPTAIGTLGVLLAARRSLGGAVLAAVPLLWLLITAVTLRTMAEPSWVVPAAVAALALAGWLVPRGSHAPR